MTARTKINSQELCKKLENHPNLLEKINKLLLIVDGEGKDEIKLGDDAEEAVVAGLRGFGNELLEEWGKLQVQRSSYKF